MERSRAAGPIQQEAHRSLAWVGVVPAGLCYPRTTMASLDPVAFVRGTPPFDGLPPFAFDDAAKALEIVFLPVNTRILQRGGAPSEHLYVIRKGAVRLERDGQTVQLLEEGEIFGFTSLISGEATLDVTVEEDLLAYRLPRAQFESCLAHAPFAGHFASGLAERLRNSLERSQVAGFQPDLAVPVSSLLRGPAVRISPGATVGEAARVMADASVSSVIVDSEPPGILTDRDFRRRVLAAGRGPETPVLEVYSAPLQTVTAETPVYEAWRILLDSGVHHLPVKRGADIIGVLSATDLLKCTAAGPVAVMKRVERLSGRDALPGYSAKLTEMAAALFAGGLEPTVIGGFVARLNDTLLGRILKLAESDLGPPPTPYAWLAYGSEGRREQLLLTDQDNALVWGDDTAEARQYFTELARLVITDLVTAGFPRCPGGYMATNWNGPLAEWEDRFHTWLDAPTPKALLEASIFFDFRAAQGALRVDSLEQIVQRARSARVFLAAMAKSALTFHPPVGLLLRLRGESSTIDMKLKGISPIVFLARVYGLETGARSSNTLERLAEAVRSGRINKDTCDTLGEAYRFLLRLRLREQIRMLSEGRPAVNMNMISLSDLSSLERSRLRDTFRAIEDWQERASFHYRTDLF
jgi:CBS domain-containing protein